MAVFLYKDVPLELVELLNEINFRLVRPEQLHEKLTALDAFAQTLVKSGNLKPRTNRDVPAGTFTVYESVPQAAADVLNKYQYPAKLSAVEKIGLKHKALQFMRKEGIPLRSA